MIGSSRNSISWMKKSRSTFSQEDGTLRYQNRFFQAVHLGLIHQCSSKAEAHIFWLRLEKKKPLGPCRASCQRNWSGWNPTNLLQRFNDLSWFISFTWVSQYERWVDDSCPNLNHPVVWHGVFDDHQLLSLRLTHMNARLFGPLLT